MDGARSFVEVVIVHRDAPLACARSIEAFGDQGVAVNVTVVDNGSSGTSMAELAERAPEVDVVPLGHNAGFGPAANAGLSRWLAREGGEWAVVAPHDALPAPGCLRRILSAAAGRPGSGLLSAEFGRGHDSRPVIDRYLGAYALPGRAADGWADADFPHGTLLVARRAALVDIGLFDERYFAYVEEADLGRRARKAGWEVGIVWGAVVVNPELPQGPVTSYLQLRNTLLLVKDHFGAYPAGVRCAIAALSLTHRSLDRSTRRRSGGAAVRRAEARAIVDFLRGRFGPPPPGLGEHRPGTGLEGRAASDRGLTPQPSAVSVSQTSGQG